MELNTLYESKSRPMPKRKFGSTGFDVGIFSLGGQGSLETHQDHDGNVEIIRRAYELGVNYFDTSPVYGPSEDIYGDALVGIRDKIFLATKTHDRTRDGSWRLLEKSLDKMKTDYIDLWQIHNLKHEEEVDEALADDGAIQAMLEAKEQGIIKFLGITGHEKPDVLHEAMKRHDFDTVLCPVNACDKHMRTSFISETLPRANRKNMGIIGMKVFAQGYVFHPRGITTTWEALTYALTQNLSTVICGVDNIPQLEENIAIAKSFEPLTRSQIELIEAKADGHERRGCFFRSEYGGYGSQDKLREPYSLRPKH